jgi:type I restriction enzyme S subunit
LLKSLKLGRFDRSTAIPGLNRNDAYKLTIPLPPLKEQNRIVTKIEELFTQLDAGVDSLKKVQIQLKRYRQAVLKAAFEGKLTQGWREHHTGLTVKTNEKFSNDAGGTTFNIPNEWVWINLGLVIESMKNGIYKLPQFYADDGIACLRMYNIENGKIVWKDIKRMTLSEKESDTYLLTEGDLLVNRVNSRELVGKAAVIPCNLEKCVYESKNIRMRFYKNMIDSKLVNYWFLHYAQTYFDKNAQQTVGMASINQHQLSIMPFPLCDILEQKIIIEEIERNFSIADEVVQVIQVSLKQAESLKQSILKRAFEGKLVPQDPTDEPASVLLDRIEEEKAKNNSTAKSGKAIKPLNLRGKV